MRLPKQLWVWPDDEEWHHCGVETDGDVMYVRYDVVKELIDVVDVCTCGSGPEFRDVNLRFHSANCSKHTATMLRAKLLS